MVLLLSGSFIGALGSHGLKISFFTQILLIVLILGAGTDYGLFLVFRVREELLSGQRSEGGGGRRGAPGWASRSPLRPRTVVVALLSLTLASFGIYHDLGRAAGHRHRRRCSWPGSPCCRPCWPSWVGPSSGRPRPRPGTTTRGLWGRVAGRLVQRPALTLCLGVVVFGVLAVFALGFKPGGFGGEVTAPAGSDAAKGNAALAAHFPQSSANPTNIVMRFRTRSWVHPEALVVDGTATAGLRDSAAASPPWPGPSTRTGPRSPPPSCYSVHRQAGRLRPGAGPTAPVPPAGSTVPAALYDAYLATARYIERRRPDRPVGGGARGRRPRESLPGPRRHPRHADHRGRGGQGGGGRRPAGWPARRPPSTT